MRKLIIIVFMSAFAVIGALSANDGNKRFSVVVSYSTYCDYYDAQTGVLVAKGRFTGSQTYTSYQYAETANEAEDLAKSQCSTACSSNYKYLGTTTYNGKTCKVYENTKINSARASELKAK